jgi:hypothetical protein
MRKIHVLTAAAVTVAAWAAGPPGSAGPARAADLYSLEARVMAVEARVRELTTFRQPDPPPSSGNEALRQRILTLELTLAEMQNALKHVRQDLDDLKAARPR